MTTSGTYAFAPSIGECMLNAFSRCRIRAPMVKTEHLATAQMEANLMQQEWNNQGPNLWAQDSTQVICTAGQATYPVQPETVMVTNVTIALGNPPLMEELTITPVSRQMYSMYPNKQQQGRPTVYWFDRLLAGAPGPNGQAGPSLTLWPVPDQAYTLTWWRFRLIQDAAIAGALNFEIPSLWLDAACAGMAYRLSVHYAQDLEGQREKQAIKAYGLAAKQNVEDAPIYLLPQLEGYWR